MIDNIHRILSKATYNQKAIIFLLAVFALLLFGNNWVSLWDQDEAAYAGFAKNMVETGNYLIPKFMWSDVHRKPPLHFWDIALAFKLFGVNEFAVRFPSVLFITLTFCVTYFFGKKIFGERETLMGVIILSSSFLVMALAKVSVADGTLLLYTTLCAIAILHVLLYRTKVWVFTFWLSFALALLTKGPPIILFTAVFVFLLFVFHPNRKNLFLLHPWFFLPLAVLPLLYWGYLCYQTPEGKTFILWMIDWYILKRIGGSVFGQTGPPGTHLLSLFIFFIGLFAYMPLAIWQSVKNLFKNFSSTNFLLSAWFFAGWFIYEFSPSKLPAYVIAAHVPLALIIAQLMLTGKVPARGLRIAQTVFFAILFTALIAAPFILNGNTTVKIALPILGLCLLAFLTYTAKQKPLTDFTAGLSNYARRLLFINIIFQVVLWAVVLPLADQFKNSSYRISQFVNEHANRQSKIIIANSFSWPPSLPFYLMMHYNDVSEEYDYTKLAGMYNTNRHIAFILSQPLKDEFEKNYPGIRITEIKPFFSDRINVQSYYILIK